MKKTEHQLECLLRAAAAAPRPRDESPAAAPNVAWLLRQRETASQEAQRATRSVLQIGLATACVLLMMTLLVSRHHLQQTSRDVFTASQEVFTRMMTP